MFLASKYTQVEDSSSPDLGHPQMFKKSSSRNVVLPKPSTLGKKCTCSNDKDVRF